MSSDGDATSEGKYPGNSSSNESVRLSAQHNLVVQALGGLVLCPVDLSKPEFQALDSATANGHFLVELRKQLKHPQTATLIGTDVVTYADHHVSDGTDSVQFRSQNVLEPWPTDLHGRFDFVHQRALMANIPAKEPAVDVLRGLIGLVKPGGWIQLVDSWMSPEEISEDDTAGTKLWKTIGAFYKKTGLDPLQGKRLRQLLESAGGVINIESRTGTVILGKGCAPGYEEDSTIQLHGLREVLGNAIKRMPNPPVTYENYMTIASNALEEAEQKGIEMPWCAVWAQRAEG